MWAGVVSGRRPSQTKPIPGTTNVLGDYPSLNKGSGQQNSCQNALSASSSMTTNSVTSLDSLNSTQVTSFSTDTSSSLEQGFSHSHASYADACRLINQGFSATSSILNAQEKDAKRPPKKETSQYFTGKSGKHLRRKEKGFLGEPEEKPWGRQNSQNTRSEPGSKQNRLPHYRRAFSGGPASPSYHRQNERNNANFRDPEGYSNGIQTNNKGAYVRSNYSPRNVNDSGGTNYSRNSKRQHSGLEQIALTLTSSSLESEDKLQGDGGNSPKNNGLQRFEKVEEVEAEEGWDIVGRKRRPSFRLGDN